MAERTPPFNSSYNKSLRRAYAYRPVYRPGQSQGNLNTWNEAGAPDSSNDRNNVVRRIDYGAAAPARGASSPDSRQQGPSQLPDSVVSSTSAPEERSPLPSGSNTASFNRGAIETPHAASDSSDISPNSWKSSSSRESLCQMDPATWAQTPNNEATRNSPVASTSRKDVKTNEVAEQESANDPERPVSPDDSSNALPKVKARMIFSEAQMSILKKWFLEKKYVTPTEMKNLSKLTGLSYKQVKTWFQNQRMKLRRSQKSPSAASEGYIRNSVPTHSMNLAFPLCIQYYQGSAQPQLQEPFIQKMTGPVFNAPQNLTFYLATMGPTSAAAGHPGPSQSQPATRQQAAGWSVPPRHGQHVYNPNVFNPGNVPANTLGYDAGFEVRRGQPCNAFSFNAARGHDVGK